MALKEDTTGEQESKPTSSTGLRQLGAAETLARLPSGETTGETSTVDDTQSDTADEEGEGNVNEDEADASDDDGDEEGAESDESDKDEDDDDADLGSDKGSEDDEEQDDDEVELPQLHTDIIEDLEKTDPERARLLRKDFIETEDLRLSAEAVHIAEHVFLDIVEAVVNPETGDKAVAEMLDWLAEKRDLSREELLTKAGITVVPSGAEAPQPDFLNEENQESLIEEVLKDAEFDEAAKEDAVLGAQMMLAEVRKRHPELFPPEYHQWTKQSKESAVREKEKSEVASVVKSNYANVATKIKRRYGDYQLTIEQAQEAADAFPTLTKQPDADGLYNAVRLHLEDKLLKHIGRKKSKRAKKKMPVTPKKGDNKPQARSTTFKPGTQKGMSVAQALGEE